MRQVAALARAQHGLITLAQLLACGVSGDQVKRWLRAGRLERVHPGVYRLPGAPSTWEQRLLAAVMGAGPGAAASHRAAARLWGLGHDDPVEVSVRRGRLPRPAGVVLHRSTDLDDGCVRVRRGIPVTDPLRTLVDLGAVLPAWAVEDAVDRALVARLVTVAGLETVLDDLGRPGRRGTGVLREVLDRRALGADRPDGLLEPRMARLLQRHDLPPAVFQHEVRDGRRFVARVDFAYPDRRVALEVDGWETHATPAALQDDLACQNALVALGWTVLRFTWADVVSRPGRVAVTIQSVLGTSRGGIRTTTCQDG